MVRIKLIVGFFCLGIHFCALAQNRYMVFFTDKNSTPYSTNVPQDFLSTKAIERYQAQSIAIIEQDLPVDPSYVIGVEAEGAQVFYTSRWMNAALIQSAPELINNIINLPYVSSVDFVAEGPKLGRPEVGNNIEQGQSVGNEESYAQQALMGVNTLKAGGYRGEGILIAMMDYGYGGVDVAASFADLHTNNQILQTFDFVNNSNNIFNSSRDHATRVLSAMAATIDGQYEGIAPAANYLLYITEDVDSEYRIEEYNFLLAAEKADSAGVDIINLSLGYSTGFTQPVMNYNYSQLDGGTAVVTLAAELAFQKGILVVTSAGNRGDDATEPYITAPADGPNVLSVGAVNVEGERAYYSSIGPNYANVTKPDIMAVGAATSLINGQGTVGTYSGTSFASPLVAGLAALLWQREPTLTNVELLQLIRSMGDRAAAPNNEYGYGIPNYNSLIMSTDEYKEEMVSLFPNPVQGNLNINSSVSISHIYIFNLSGGLIMDFDGGGATSLEITLDNKLESGMYLLRILLSNGSIENRKITKN